MLGINANSVVNSHTHTNMLVNTVLRPINSALKGRYAHWNAIIAIRFLLFTVRHKNTIFDQHREALPRFPALFFFFLVSICSCLVCLRSQCIFSPNRHIIGDNSLHHIKTLKRDWHCFKDIVTSIKPQLLIHIYVNLFFTLWFCVVSCSFFLFFLCEALKFV